MFPKFVDNVTEKEGGDDHHDVNMNAENLISEVFSPLTYCKDEQGTVNPHTDYTDVHSFLGDSLAVLDRPRHCCMSVERYQHKQKHGAEEKKRRGTLEVFSWYRLLPSESHRKMEVSICRFQGTPYQEIYQSQASDKKACWQ